MSSPARHYGKYRGTVLSNVHSGKGGPDGMIQFSITMGGTPFISWATPCVPFAGGTGPQACAFYMLPPIGAGVWIEFEEGLIDKPIWSGCYWRAGELTTALLPDAASPSTGVLVYGGGRVKFDLLSGVTVQTITGVEVQVDKTQISIKVGPNKIQVSLANIALNGANLMVLP